MSALYRVDYTADGSGTYVQDVAGQTLDKHRLVYRGAAGTWLLADADAVTSMPVIGLTLEAIPVGLVGRILISGYVADVAWSWAVGGSAGQIYASQTAGELTQTAPPVNSQVVAISMSATSIMFGSSSGGGGGAGTFDPEHTASYIVWVDGATYYAKNGHTGAITSGANAATLINGLIASGVTIYFKEGSYDIDTKLLVSDLRGVSLIGNNASYNGTYGTSFKWTGAGGGILLEIYASQYIRVDNIGFSDAATLSTAILINGDNTPTDRHIYIEHINITKFLCGIKIYPTGHVGGYQIADMVVTNFGIYECTTGIEINTQNYDEGIISNGAILYGTNAIVVNHAGNVNLVAIEGGGQTNAFLYLVNDSVGISLDHCVSEASLYYIYAEAASWNAYINIKNTILDADIVMNNTSVSVISIETTKLNNDITLNTDNYLKLNGCWIESTCEIEVTGGSSITSMGCLWDAACAITLTGLQTQWASYGDRQLGAGPTITGTGTYRIEMNPSYVNPFEETASFVIWADSKTAPTVYYAKNGTTDKVTSNADATTLIHACITALPVSQGTIYFKSGLYEIDTKVLLTEKTGISLVGESSSYIGGATGTIFKWNAAAGILLELYACQSILIKDISFYDPDTDSTAILINGDNTPIIRNIYIENVVINEFLVGLKVYPTGDANAFQVSELVFNKFEIIGCTTGIEINTVNCGATMVSNGFIYGGTSGIVLNNCGTLSLVNLDCEASTNFIYMNGATGVLNATECKASGGTYYLYITATGGADILKIDSSLIAQEVYLDMSGGIATFVNCRFTAQITINDDNRVHMMGCYIDNHVHLISYGCNLTTIGCSFLASALVYLTGAMCWWASVNDSGFTAAKLGATTGKYDIISNRDYVTKNSGTATLLNGQNHVHVTHGLSYTPTAADISITFTEAPTNTTTYWYLSTPDATEFILYANDPGASNLDFSWAARKTP